MPLQRLDTNVAREPSLLSPVGYDDDAASIHSAGSGRSDQDTDSEDDELQMRARNSRELLAHDRIVLMEDEETEQLVTRTRQSQGPLQRRESALQLPNPFKIFNARTRSRSNSPSAHSLAVGSSTDDIVLEKRKARKQRRERKKNRIVAKAQHGEDGELMYEMEEGGMKDGSSTGSSSDRDDSDELDRMQLLKHADAREAKGKTWRKWILVYSIILVGFILLVLVAWKVSKLHHKHWHINMEPISNGSALFAPTTIIISLDGFRADFLNRGLTPRLNAFIKEGVSPLYMTPSFPSVTFPNHYTLATGLYPEAHGVVGNTFWDPELREEFYYTDPARSLDPKWWGGEPFWVTAEKAGIRTAIHMWPGSEAHILGIEPTFMDKYNGKEKLPNKVDRILEFLDKPGMEVETAKVEEMRPQIVAAYVPNVDADGHKYGPNSTEIRDTIQNVDTMLDQIFTGLEERNLTKIVNVIVVSDHGMATTDMHRVIQLEDLVDINKIEHTDGWPLVGLRPKSPNDLQGLYQELVEKSEKDPNWDVYLRDENMPERYHFSQNDRIAPLWIIPKTGWAVVMKEEYDVAASIEKDEQYHPRGLHGYDHENPLMRAIFVARGPAFPHEPHSKVEVFQNINVYNILCDSVGLESISNNGTMHLPLKVIGPHADGPYEEPVDPVTSSPAESPTPSSTPKIPTTSKIAPASSDAGSDKDPSTTSAEASKVEPTTTPDEGASKGDDKDGVNETIENWWDWLKGTAEDLWNKVTGKDGDEGSKNKSNN
ncbi:hypothetical protein MKZ38_000111 [Zalerion maritima]|uniref:Uncharacterized protein n=1 Tax=Zalerion maritima TaxID=339359 RepID=A0AAD5RTF3_9PEZI|nr:hypothetical protein MKZ38_000111 [Zalerion maritima]